MPSYEVLTAKAWSNKEGTLRRGSTVQVIVNESQLNRGEIVGLTGDLRCYEVFVSTCCVFKFRGHFQRGEAPPRLSEFAQLGVLPMGESFPGCHIVLHCVVWEDDESPDIQIVLRERHEPPSAPVADGALKTLELVNSIVQGRK
jgi:hypothetical protein